MDLTKISSIEELLRIARLTSEVNQNSVNSILEKIEGETDPAIFAGALNYEIGSIALNALLDELQIGNTPENALNNMESTSPSVFLDLLLQAIKQLPDKTSAQAFLNVLHGYNLDSVWKATLNSKIKEAEQLFQEEQEREMLLG